MDDRGRQIIRGAAASDGAVDGPRRPASSSAQRRAWREALVARRQALDAQRRSSLDARIAAALIDCVDALIAAGETTGRVIGVYLPTRGEPDIGAAATHWRAQGRALALPRVAGRGQPLAYGLWDAAATLVADRFDIAVPQPFRPVVPDLLVAPCVGYSREGYRLGYGAGYFDLTLAALQVPCVGVAYADCVLEGFVPHAQDLPMRAIVTEQARRPSASPPA